MAKETIKLPRGEVHTISLNENREPFSTGQNTYEGVQKNWFGYNIKKNGTEYVYFATDATHNIIQASGVTVNQDFTLELRSYKDNDGNPKNAWFLNGKSSWEYNNSDEHKKYDTTSVPEPSIDPKKMPMSTEKSLEDRVKALEDWRQECNVDKDGEKIPF